MWLTFAVKLKLCSQGYSCLKHSLYAVLPLTVALLPATSTAATVASTAATIKSRDASFIVEKVVSGFDIPWAITFIQTDTLLVTQRSGGVFLVDIPSAQVHTVNNVPQVWARGQGGMLDAVTAPDYPINPWHGVW